MFCYKGSMQFLILVYVNFAFQLDSLLQQSKSEQLEKLEAFKAMLERLITFLQVSKNNITPSFKEKLGSYEKQIVSFLNPSRFRRPIPNLQLGQLPSLQFLNCSPNKINWIPSCNQWMCTALYQRCSRTICQACSMVLFHLYLGFLCHSQTRWCGTRDFKKRKGGRENDEDIVAKISQDLLQIQAKIFD